jgi:CcmD family protein
MDTLTIACSAAWVFVGAYVAWMAIQHAHLARRLDELQDAKIENSDCDHYSKVA